MAGTFQRAHLSAISRQTSVATPSARRMLQSQRSRSGRLNANAVASVERALRTVSADNLSDGEIKHLLARPRIDFTSILNTVSSSWTGRKTAAAEAVPGAAVATVKEPWHGQDTRSAARACLAVLRSWQPQFSVACKPAANASAACCVLQVAPIVERVRNEGDEAVKAYTQQFDRVQLESVCVPIEVRAPTPADSSWLYCAEQQVHSACA